VVWLYLLECSGKNYWHVDGVVFISCKPPVDPVKLVATHIQNVERTGVTRTRWAASCHLPSILNNIWQNLSNTHRLVPVSGNCVANLPEIQSLCLRIFTPFFARDQERKYTVSFNPPIAACVADNILEGVTVQDWIENPEPYNLVSPCPYPTGSPMRSARSCSRPDQPGNLHSRWSFQGARPSLLNFGSLSVWSRASVASVSLRITIACRSSMSWKSPTQGTMRVFLWRKDVSLTKTTWAMPGIEIPKDLNFNSPAPNNDAPNIHTSLTRKLLH